MKTEANESAYPKHNMVDGSLCVDGRDSGLSKREYFASAFMQGMISNSATNLPNGMKPYVEYGYSQYAKEAVTAADALIAELNK